MNISLVETETAVVEEVDDTIHQLQIAEVGDEVAITMVKHMLTMLHNTKACKEFVIKVSDAISADKNVEELRAFMKYIELEVNDQTGVASYVKMLIKPDTRKENVRKIDEEIRDYSKKSFEFRNLTDEYKQIKKDYLLNSGASSIMGGKSLFPYFGDTSNFHPQFVAGNNQPRVHVLNANKNIRTQMTESLYQLQITDVVPHDNYLQNDELTVTKDYDVAKAVESLRSIRKDQLKCGFHTLERLEEFSLDEERAVSGIINFIRSKNVLIRYPSALHVGTRGDVYINMIVENVVFNVTDDNGNNRELKIVLALSVLKSGLGYKSDIAEYIVEGVASSMSGFAITAIDKGDDSVHRTGFSPNPGGLAPTNLTFKPFSMQDPTYDGMLNEIHHNTDGKRQMNLPIKHLAISQLLDEGYIDESETGLIKKLEGTRPEYTEGHSYEGATSEDILNMDSQPCFSFLRMLHIRKVNPESFLKFATILMNVFSKCHSNAFAMSGNLPSRVVLDKIFAGTVTATEHNKVVICPSPIGTYDFLRHVPNSIQVDSLDCFLRLLLSIVTRTVSSPGTTVPLILHSHQTMILMTTPLCVGNNTNIVEFGVKKGKVKTLPEPSLTIYAQASSIFRSLFLYTKIPGNASTFGIATKELEELKKDGELGQIRDLLKPFIKVTTSLCNYDQLKVTSKRYFKVLLGVYGVTYGLDMLIMDIIRALTDALIESRKTKPVTRRVFLFMSDPFAIQFCFPDVVKLNSTVYVHVQNSVRRSRVVKPLKNVDGLVVKTGGHDGYVNEYQNRNFFLNDAVVEGKYYK